MSARCGSTTTAARSWTCRERRGYGGDVSTSRLDPVQGVLEILDRAAMTGTNKLGLLLTLLDLAPTLGGGSRSISRSDLARTYLEIHWEHARPYQGVALRQSSGKKPRNDGTVADDTTVMQEIHSLRELLTASGRGDLSDKPLDMVQHNVEGLTWHPDWQEAFDEALARVQLALFKNPVKWLQALPGEPDPFLYHSDGSGLTMLDGVAESLTKFAGVLRPLIEFRFAQAVMKINRESLQAPIDDVYSHLFGRERIMPPEAMRRDLVEIQQGRCILSDVSLPAGGGSLDHVVPWARARLSQVENFLITTRSVNSGKSDSLLAPVVVERWLRHQQTNHQAIQECAQRHHWLADIKGIRDVMRHTYGALDATTAVWDPDSGLRPLGESGKREVLELLR